MPETLDLRDKPVRSLGELVVWCSDLKLPRVLLTEEQRSKLGFLDARVVDVAQELPVTPRELQCLSIVEVG